MHWLDKNLYIDPAKCWIDPHHPVKRAIITHGHADHAIAGHGCVLATPDTIAIMMARYGPDCAQRFQPLEYGETLDLDGVRISFHPAGHILGSAQVLLEHKGRRVVCTGDYKTRPDPTTQAFELVQCDVFITEATFGLPVFRHPAPLAEVEKLLASLSVEPHRTHVVGAYALGKAQRVIRLLRDRGYDKPIYLHGAQAKLCDFYQRRGVDLGALEPVQGMDKADLAGEIVVAPPSALRDKWSRRLAEPLPAFASGWMSVRQRAKQRLVELPLVISDHADWDELTETIPATGAEEIWVTHGREDALVHWCQSRGLKAEALSLMGRDEEPGD